MFSSISVHYSWRASRSNVEVKQGMLFVLAGYAAADLAGVAQQMITAATVVKVNALVAEEAVAAVAVEEEEAVVVAVVTLKASSHGLHLKICLSIVMMLDALLKDSTLTMLSFQQQRPFPTLVPTGDIETRKREIAAFFGQTSHETTGGWPTAPDGPFAWGYCFIREVNPSAYCDPSSIAYPCAPGKQYYGRGPIQLSWNYNYGQCGEALGLDLLNNPDLVATDPVISFKTAIWFWMTPQSPKPSCHDVIIGEWIPSEVDKLAGRLPGYGTTTNIINGGLECGIGPDSRVENRIGFYKTYCDLFGIEFGDNLDCFNQRPFGSGLLLDTI
ncbi:Chitinase [Quillaja saponaria]|uniref:Chitinase n=1 Tax=Quillaja saponaria TaxID=32244 RepID=A0AAD7QBW0_QUISA|nr:Chitinase [Quillaja saponaria]